MNYDVVGDVHGQVEKLAALLRRLGYRETRGVWRHPDRTAIFVGDLIDRGPKQATTVDLVRKVVDAGTAHCILGNHEVNAIAWATPDPGNPGEYLRRHGCEDHRKQHADFLAEVEEAPLHRELIAWFKTLPLWLDLGPIRVIHACWNDQYIDELKPFLGQDHTLTDELIRWSSRKGHWAYAAVGVLCKGLEVELPEGASFEDNDGRIRTAMRIQWWNSDLSTYRKSALVTRDSIERIPDIPMPADGRVKPYEGFPCSLGTTGGPDNRSCSHRILPAWTTVRVRTAGWSPTAGKENRRSPMNALSGCSARRVAGIVASSFAGNHGDHRVSPRPFFRRNIF